MKSKEKVSSMAVPAECSLHSAPPPPPPPPIHHDDPQQTSRDGPRLTGLLYAIKTNQECVLLLVNIACDDYMWGEARDRGVGGGGCAGVTPPRSGRLSKRTFSPS